MGGFEPDVAEAHGVAVVLKAEEAFGPFAGEFHLVVDEDAVVGDGEEDFVGCGIRAGEDDVVGLPFAGRA